MIWLATTCGLAYEATAADARRDTATLRSGIEHAQTGCTLAPNSSEAWTTLAWLHRLNGNGDAAAAAACRAAELEQIDTRHALLLGYASWGGERLRIARRLLALAPELALAHWLAASVLIARGAVPAAAEELRLGCLAQDAHPHGSILPAVGLHLLDGLLHLAHDRLDPAEAALTRERTFAGSGHLFARECEANTWYALGALRLRQHRPADADEAFRRVLTISPSHASAAAVLGVAVTPKNDIDAAIGRAIALTRAGQHEQAARVYCSAVSQAPPGNAGWLLPVEPILHPLARPEIWGEALALIRLRAL